MDESVSISNCPSCGREHSYGLKVNREVIAGLATQPQLRREVSFVRSFTCPAEDQQFEATITLYETPMNPIESVEVAGVVDPDEEQ